MLSMVASGGETGKPPGENARGLSDRNVRRPHEAVPIDDERLAQPVGLVRGALQDLVAEPPRRGLGRIGVAPVQAQLRPDAAPLARRWGIWWVFSCCRMVKQR